MSCGIPSIEHVHYGYRARILLYPYYKSESLAEIFPASETALKQLSFCPEPVYQKLFTVITRLRENSAKNDYSSE